MVLSGCGRKSTSLSQAGSGPPPGPAAKLEAQAGAALKKGKIREARKIFLTAVQRYPEDAHAWASAGAFFASTGDMDRAIQDFEKAATHGSYAGIEQSLAALYFKKGLPARTLTHAQKALELNPKLPLAEMLLVDALLSQGQRPEALREVQKAVTIFPRDGGLWAVRGDVELALGAKKNAASSYRKALALNQDNPRASLGQALLMSLTGNKQQAVATLEKALRYRTNPDVLVALAKLLLSDPKRHAESMSLARRAHLLQPDNPEYKFVLARTLFAHGKTLDAARLLEETVIQVPGSLAAWLLLERAYSQMGLLDKSRQILEGILADKQLKLTGDRLALLKGRLQEVRAKQKSKRK